MAILEIHLIIYLDYNLWCIHLIIIIYILEPVKDLTLLTALPGILIYNIIS